MYLSLLKIKNFRCFDGNEHIIIFNKGLNVLVGENDSGKSTIMDAIKIALGTTDMNWYRISQEDFYKEDVNKNGDIEIKFIHDDTCWIAPGTYYYEVKVFLPLDKEDENIDDDALVTIVPRRKFIIL